MLNWLRPKKPEPSAPAPATPVAQGDADELMRQAFPLHQAGKVAEAGRLYREILGFAPDNADAHYLLGCIEHEAGRHPEAIPHLRNALRIDRKNPHFQQTMGLALYAMGLWHEALAHFQSAAELDPDNFESWSNLGSVYERLGRSEEAVQHFEKALAMAPDSPAVLANAALSLKHRGRIDEAIGHYRRLRDLTPDVEPTFSNYLSSLTYSARPSPAEIFQAHVEFDRYFGTGRHGVKAPPASDRNPDRRLRIGYFSPDLRSHPVAVFLEGVLAHHDTSVVEIYCYHLYPRRDPVSERLKLLCDCWVECTGLDNAALARRIEQDRIDVLVDLAGHTADNRIAVLGLKPAPIIATWLGYPNTTGLKTVDYRITDAVCDPPGVERFHTEAVYRLPGAQWCYNRPPFEMPVTALPAAGDGHVRFASFNNTAKLTDDMLRVWAQLLQRIDNSSLLIWGAGDDFAQRVRQVVRNAGADPGRLEFSPRTAFDVLLTLHQRTDIALDTFPYSGVTTTFNSLWMGVPVLTLAGEVSASRSSLSILSALNLQDWAVYSPQDLIETAVRKVADLEALAQLRAGLRERLEASALMDGPAFARKLEAAYREMWRTHCRSAAPQ